MPKATDVTALMSGGKAKPTTTDPFAKFGARTGPGGVIVKGPEETPIEEKAKPKEGEEPPEVKNAPPAQEKPVQQAPKPTKEQFLKGKITEAEQARRDADDARARLQEVEEALKTDRTKLADLEAQLAAAKSPKDFEAIQTQLADATKRTEELEGKYKEAENKNKFYSYLEDEDFKKDYVQPLETAWGTFVNIIGPNEEQNQILARIGNLQETSLIAPNAETRIKLERERDILFGQLIVDLPEYSKTRAGAAFNDIISRSTARHNEISNWQVGQQRTQEQREERRRLAGEMVKTRWNSAYQAANEVVAPELIIPDDLRTIMETYQIVPDPTKDEAIAADIISGGGNFQPEDMARVIRQGGAYVVAVGKIKALQQQVKELTNTLKTVRGERGGGREEGGGGERNKTVADKQDEKQDNFFKRYAPPTK